MLITVHYTIISSGRTNHVQIEDATDNMDAVEKVRAYAKQAIVVTAIINDTEAEHTRRLASQVAEFRL